MGEGLPKIPLPLCSSYMRFEFRASASHPAALRQQPAAYLRGCSWQLQCKQQCLSFRMMDGNSSVNFTQSTHEAALLCVARDPLLTTCVRGNGLPSAFDVLALHKMAPIGLEDAYNVRVVSAHAMQRPFSVSCKRIGPPHLR